MTDNVTVYKVAFALMVIGGLNWLLIGVLETNLVTEIFGAGDFARLIYVLVGLATLYIVFVKANNRKRL
ncbi:MAG: DUF378 domain-containing protein [bacterium]|nr:DUF378 domain-containing protein [bacterium]